MQWFFFILATLIPNLLLANPERTPHVTAQIVSEDKALTIGGSSWLGIRLVMEDHWHTYWKNPGDSGLPTRVEWHLPKDWKISEPHFAIPKRIPLGPIVNFGYEGETLIGFKVDIPGQAEASSEEISANVSWLVCKEECIPESLTLKTKVNLSKINPQKNPWARVFDKLRAEQPVAFLLDESIDWAQEDKAIRAEIRKNNIFEKVLDVFPLDQKVFSPESPIIKNSSGKIELELKKKSPAPKGMQTLKLLLVTDKGNFSLEKELVMGVDSQQSNDVSGSSVFSLWVTIFFAFIGGIILNFMPCVFPVLGIKALSLLKVSRAEARANGLIYSLGILVSFWILTAVLLFIRASGSEIGWGFQLQNPYFVTALVLLFSFMSANLAGFFELPSSFMGVGSSLAGKEGAWGSFFTGALTVIVATPCSAPFMGTAIGVALSQNTGILFLIFSFLAIGLAFPFLLLSLFPGFVNCLPKPGNWMNRLKEFFAIPLALTVVWLLWVLSLQVESFGIYQILAALIILFSGIWVLNKFSTKSAKFIGILCILVALFLSFRIQPRLNASIESGLWKPYNEQNIQEDLKKEKTVFIDFTAAWCVTCQVNKQLVLNTSSMQKYFSEKDIQLYVADWTNSDPVITSALQKVGRASVPVYLVLKPSGEQTILPQILTEDIVKKSVP
ncbi:MAG: thioredoxin family protein [Oligoflexia bacterium]|nr:thioredoxin family protein [Oligoflexia bacterium]